MQLLRALEQELAGGFGLVDVLPVSGVDAGALHDRLNGPGGWPHRGQDLRGLWGQRVNRRDSGGRPRHGLLPS